MNNQKLYTVGTVEHAVDPKTGNRKTIFRAEQSYADYGKALKVAHILLRRGHNTVAINGEIVTRSVPTAVPVPVCYFRVRAFRPVLNPRNKTIVKRTVCAFGAEDALFKFNTEVPVKFEHYTFQMGGRVC